MVQVFEHDANEIVALINAQRDSSLREVPRFKESEWQNPLKKCEDVVETTAEGEIEAYCDPSAWWKGKHKHCRQDVMDYYQSDFSLLY